ncbi:MAG: glycosyltransferase, partial [Firmicutes bacterium]|nr:glycosyltransferase [Bacillota bacterium]
MKIAQLNSKYYPNIGGVERFIQKTSEIMVKYGYSVDVITSDFNNRLENFLTINGVNVRRFSKSLPFHYSFPLSNYIKDNFNKYDIIHAHNFHTLVPLLSSIVKYRTKNSVPLMLMGHYHGKGSMILSDACLKVSRFLFSKAYSVA